MISLLYLSLIIVSIVLFYYAHVHYQKTTSLLDTGNKTQGRVVKLLEVRDSDGTTYKPVFGYKDLNGIQIEFESNTSSKPAAYDPGDVVQIVHSDDNSEHMVISYWGLYSWTIVLLVLAAPIFIVGVGYFLYTKG